MTTLHIPSHRFRAGRQAGFTLVELITVILILGVLAAVAIPRYTDLQSKAREAKVRAVGGSIKAAAGIVKAQAMASSVNCATAVPSPISLEGRSIALNHCYPQSLTAFNAGILGAANVEDDGSWTVAVSSSPAAGAAGAVLTLTLAGATTAATCKVDYTAATSTDPALVVVETGGC